MSKELHKDICDEHVFRSIYQKHSKDVHDFLYYKYGDTYNPADKTQDAFLKLWENCKKTTLQTVRSYLFTIANNLMLNEVKHQKVVLKYQKVKPKDYTNESPEFLLEQEQFREKYQIALSNLTEEQRVAFTMSKIEGRKYKEIAEILGITVKVVEYRVLSAFQSLKSELGGFKIK